MADGTLLSTNVGSGDTIDDYVDSANSRKVPAGCIRYFTGGSAGAWTFQSVDSTHGLPVAVVAAIPAGTNVIGHIIVDSGTITTVSAVTAITNALPAGTNTIGAVSPAVTTTGGATPGRYLAAASANQDSTVIKNAAGQLYNAVAIVNVNAAIRYVKFYNKPSAPTSADTPVLTIGVPGNTAGAGIVVPIPSGSAFSAGISFRMTTGQADNDTGAVTAGDLAMSYFYD